jgi:hypothetical protein
MSISSFPFSFSFFGILLLLFSFSLISHILEDLRKSVNVQNIPDSLKDSLEQYLGQSYTVIPGMFDKSQLDIAFCEWNYHTQSRGIDLNNPAT